MNNNKFHSLLEKFTKTELEDTKFLKENEFYSKIQLEKLDSLKYKKKIMSKMTDIFGMLIITISLLYLDEIILFKNKKKIRNIYLLIISGLTFFYAIFKLILNYYQIKLKKKISKYNSMSILEKNFFLTFFIFIIHPNILLDQYEIYATYKIPNEFFLTPINYFLIIFQLTIILLESLKNLIINSNLIPKKGDYLTRKNSSNLNIFYLKYFFKKKPAKLLFIFIITFIFYLSILLKIFEAPSILDKNDFSLIYWTNIIWTNSITMLTIGYGYSIPVTFFGRFIVVIAGIGGHLLFSSTIVALADFLKFDEIENSIYSKMEMQFLENELKDCSRKIVFRLVRGYKAYNNRRESIYEEDKRVIEKNIMKYKSLKERFIFRKYFKHLTQMHFT